MSSGFLAWHPSVHQRFGERLFFFLLALKSYREHVLLAKLRQLLSEFGVCVDQGHEGFCSYEVLGEFDHLLRVWLPPDKDAEFARRARELLPVDMVLQFSVQSVVFDWRFPKSPELVKVRELHREQAVRAQRGTDETASIVERHEGLAFWVETSAPSRKKQKSEAVSDDAFKAFICLKAPPNAVDMQLEYFEEQLVNLFVGYQNDTKGIRNFTFYKGVGFTWLLAKLVPSNFNSLVGLLNRISTQFGGLGLTTSTYAAARRFAEGDSIHEKAHTLAQDITVQVEQVCPALRDHEATTGEEGDPLRRSVRQFIEAEVLPAKLDETEREKIGKLLEAVLWGDSELAVQTLFLPTIQTERDVRSRLLQVAGRNHESAGIKGLIGFLETQKQEVKSPDTIPLGAVLLGAREQVRHFLPDLEDVTQLADAEIRQLTKIRNLLMHGADVKLATQWQEMARHMLLLFRVRKSFVSALDACLRKLALAD